MEGKGKKEHLMRLIAIHFPFVWLNFQRLSSEHIFFCTRHSWWEWGRKAHFRTFLFLFEFYSRKISYSNKKELGVRFNIELIINVSRR